MTKNTNEIKQIYIAENQRNASANYYENQVNYINNIQLYIMTLTEVELDKQSIENEHHFKYRFGYSFCHQLRREIIAFKQQHQWTSKDIKKLILTGGIRINKTKNKATLCFETYSYYAAWILIILGCSYYLCMLLQILNMPSTSFFRVFLAELYIASISCLTVWIFHWSLISPQHLLRNARNQVTQA